MLTAVHAFVFDSYDLPAPIRVQDRAIVLPMAQPVSLSRKNLPTIWGADPAHYRTYVVGPKANGTRKGLGWMKYDGNDVRFQVDMAGQAAKLDWDCHAHAYAKTFLDVEHIECKGIHYYWIIDALMIHGHKVRQYPLLSRLALAKLFLEETRFPTRRWEHVPAHDILQHHVYYCPTQTTFLAIKPIFYHVDALSAFAWAKQMGASGFSEDGLVYTPATQSASVFRSESMFKYKDQSHQTMDFHIQSVMKQSPDDEQMMDMFVVEQNDTSHLIHYARAPLRADDEKTPIRSRAIYECRWDMDLKSWFIVRARPDKAAPNARETVERTMQNIGENMRRHELVDFSMLGKYK